MARDFAVDGRAKTNRTLREYGERCLWGGKLVKVLKLQSSGFQNNTARGAVFLTSADPQ